MVKKESGIFHSLYFGTRKLLTGTRCPCIMATTRRRVGHYRMLDRGWWVGRNMNQFIYEAKANVTTELPPIIPYDNGWKSRSRVGLALSDSLICEA